MNEESGEVWDTDDVEEVVPRAAVTHKPIAAPKIHGYADHTADSFLGHADPFAPREGKTLTWKNVNMILVRNAAVAFGERTDLLHSRNGSLFCFYLTCQGGKRRQAATNAVNGSLG